MRMIMSEETMDFSKEFFKRVENGEDVMLFMNLGNFFDVPMIQGLLYEEGIPSFVSNKNSSVNFGGVINFSSVVKIELYIIKNDFEKAVNVIKDYNIKIQGTASMYNQFGKKIELLLNRKKIEENNSSIPNKEEEQSGVDDKDENEETKKVKNNFFNFAGVMPCAEFLFNYLVCTAIYIMLSFFCNLVLSSFEDYIGLKIAITIAFLIPCALSMYRIWICKCRRMMDINKSPWFSIIPIVNIIACLFVPSEKIGNMQAERTSEDNKKFSHFSKLCILFLLSLNLYSLVENDCYKVSEKYSKVLYSDGTVLVEKGFIKNQGLYHLLLINDTEYSIQTALYFDNETSARKLIKQIKYLKNNYPMTYADDITDDIWRTRKSEGIYLLKNNEVVKKFYKSDDYEEIQKSYSENNCDSLWYSFSSFSRQFELNYAKKGSPKFEFYKACADGNFTLAKKYLKENPRIVNIELSDYEKVRFRKYYSPENEDYFSYPIILAVLSGNEKLVKLLIEKGADINLKDSFGSSSIIYVAENGNSEIADLLFSANCDIDVKNADGISAVGMAVSNQNTRILKELLELNASTDIDITLHSPLMYYAKGNMEIINLLAEHGVSINQVSKNGYSGLLGAVQNNKIEAVKYFLNEGSNPNIIIGENFASVLILACAEGYLNIVKELISHNANINQSDIVGRTPLWSAAREGYTDIVRLLLSQQGIDIESGTMDGSSPLMIAANQGHQNVVKMLIESGANVNKRYTDGQTALFDAVRNNDKEMTNLLILYNADKTIKDNEGKTAFD